MKKPFLLALLLLPLCAVAAITYTYGTWDLYKSGVRINRFVAEDQCESALKTEAEKMTSGTITFRCTRYVTAKYVASSSSSSSSSVSSSSSSAGAALFNPGDLGKYATPREIFTVDVNSYDGAAVTLQSAVTRPGGSSKAIQIAYPNDEAGTELKFPAFPATKTLYFRFYVMFSQDWAGHWPVGLKFSRTFTQADFTTAGNTSAYSSPKLWMKYKNPESGFNPEYPIGGDPNAINVWGLCIATLNLDIGAKFPSTVTVGAGAWYSVEVFQQINSADGAGDGKLEIRINKQVAYKNDAVKWVDKARGVTQGLAGWKSMWFGGNASYADFTFPVGKTLYRYEDGYLSSTQVQWLT